MKTEYGKIENSFEVVSTFTMYGMFTEDVIVKNGGHLILYGMATKSVIVELGGIFEVFGMVNGDILNRGGEVSVHTSNKS